MLVSGLVPKLGAETVDPSTPVVAPAPANPPALPSATDPHADVAAAVPPPEDPTVTDAKAFYDWVSDKSKKKIYLRIAGDYDVNADGIMERGIDRPSRFGIMRLYPKGYDIVRRVSMLPLPLQQQVYDHIRSHQLRSGWIQPKP